MGVPMKFNNYVLLAATFAGVTLTAGCASAPTASAPAPSAKTSPRNPAITPVKDQRAMAELKAMGNTLAEAGSMSFVTTTMKPIHGPNDQWIHVLTTDTVEMQRPNKLAVVSGGDAYPQRIYFDGKDFLVSAPEAKLYSDHPMSGNIDAMLAQASKVGGVTFPFSDVLLTNPLASWTDKLEGAIYVGESTRNGEKLGHIALTAKDVDWEIWVDQKTHLPRIVYVKFTGEYRSPAVLIEFSKWKLNGKFPASDFVFKAPEGTKKVSFVAPGGTVQ
jgi:hypothetical protein